MLPSRVWVYQDTDGMHEITEAQIINEYFPWWLGKMLEAERADQISEEHCIEDFVTIYWAWLK